MGVAYQKMMLTEGTRHNVYDGMVRLENFYPTLVGQPEKAAASQVESGRKRKRLRPLILDRRLSQVALRIHRGQVRPRIASSLP